jgi:hypothetical protein
MKYIINGKLFEHQEKRSIMASASRDQNKEIFLHGLKHPRKVPHMRV